MGNSPSPLIEAAKYERPQQFVTQAHTDWKSQVERVYRGNRPTLCKTVILPPGCSLEDPRLKEGVVVSERTYTMPAGVCPQWEANTPFEVDVDGRLLPPCWGEPKLHAHYAVYPDKYFNELNCGYCELHRNSAAVHAQGNTMTVATKVDLPAEPRKRQPVSEPLVEAAAEEEEEDEGGAAGLSSTTEGAADAVAADAVAAGI